MATAAANGFDLDKFRKAVMYLDSPHENERRAFEGKAVQMCVAHGVRFCDMAAEAFGSGRERIAELEAALKKAETIGDKLARELEKYRARERWCGSCENMRRVVAVVIGGAILAGWFHWFPPQEVAPKQTSYGVLLAAAPVVFLVCRWAVIQFKRRNRWVMWRDNDVFRAVANAWNGFLERFEIDV